jgi:DNA (cytosine-5)-methyltransferase 1
MDSRGQPQAVAQPIAFQQTADCLTAGYGTNWNGNASATNGSLFAAQPISIQDVRPIEKMQNGRGWNDDGTAYTVDTHATQGVAHTLKGEGFDASEDGTGRGTPLVPVNIYGGNKRPDRPEGGFYVRMGEDTTKTLDAASGLNPTCSQGGTAVMQPVGIFQDSEFGVAQYDSAGTLRAGRIPEHQMVMQPVGCFKGGQGSAAGGIGYDEHIAPTLSAADSGSNRTPALMQGMAVRRLTPVECERLQGFPDNYTNIPWRKKDESPDGPRYKALGNSWAVPVVAWLGKRINEAVK